MVLSHEVVVNPAVNPAEMQAMLVSRDQEMIALFSDVFWEMGVGVQRYTDESSAVSRLGVGRFEALILDFDNIRDTVALIRGIRESPSSRNALIFGVATDSAARQSALQQGINFAFERPFQAPQVKTVLHTAYRLMLRERRQYFRHTIAVPVRLRRNSGAELQCTTINISRNGMGVRVPCPLELGEKLTLSFILPEVESSISDNGTVVWDDKHGKAGLRFECASLEDQNRVVAWLDGHFYRHFNRIRL